jgi:TonB family protein
LTIKETTEDEHYLLSVSLVIGKARRPNLPARLQPDRTKAGRTGYERSMINRAFKLIIQYIKPIRVRLTAARYFTLTWPLRVEPGEYVIRPQLPLVLVTVHQARLYATINNVSGPQRSYWNLKLRTSMKFAVIAIALCMLMNKRLQVASFEMQALTRVQQMLAWDLDSELPNLPFATWVKQIAGSQNGVVWQLSECGQRTNLRGTEEQDLLACVEANSVLPSGTKLIVAITVGTFKKGLNDKPAFFGAVIESKDRLYPVLQLRDLPRMLRHPEDKVVDILARKSSMKPIELPVIRSDNMLNRRTPSNAHLSLPPPSMSYSPGNPVEIKEPPPPQILQQKLVEGMVRGNAIIKVMPLRPESAKKMNAYGTVEVQIVISPEGIVIEATAISGHLALRSAAVEAARKWVFKPTTVDGIPIKVESILTFVFTRGGQ